MRSIIVSLSVGLAIGSALALIALADSAEHGAREGTVERGADFAVFQRDAPDIFSGFIPEHIAARIAEVPGVAAAANELLSFAPVDQTVQRLILGWPPESHFWRDMPILSGRAPKPGERRAAILGAGAAESLGKAVGDDLDIMDEHFTIVGIADYQSALNRSAIFVHLADLQEIGFKEGQVTVVYIELARDADHADTDRIKAEIEALGRLVVTPTDQLIANDRNFAILQAITSAVTLIALIVSALSILNALLMAVQERTREIGVMMAIGWDKPHIVVSIVVEGAVIGIAGSAIGIVLGYAASFLFSSVPTIGDYLSFTPTVGMMVWTPFWAVVLCALGSLYPAWRATSLVPAEAIRKI
ncbi:MAG: FtsX-like permease family protein [Bauldia sp.]|nr:FtsX-like permease family protein [Bauldia sp.]